MADRNQFEGFGTEDEVRPEICAVCEAVLPEAVEGTLSEAEQGAFDRHVAGCLKCARELAEVQQGAAWLAILKSEVPEPPAGMLGRILAGTTGRAEIVQPARVDATVIARPPVRFIIPGDRSPSLNPARLVHHDRSPQVQIPAQERNTYSAGGARPALIPRREATAASAGNSVWRKAVGMFRIESARATFQPRLAMTAAMAFFSIALTLNLTGVRLRDVRAESFTISGLRRTLADASASATRSFQNMRVVYQVESRVSELRSDDLLNGGQDSSRDQDPSGPSR